MLSVNHTVILTKIFAEDRLVFAEVISVALRHISIISVLEAFAGATLLTVYWRRRKGFN